jgi:hypothetical protein
MAPGLKTISFSNGISIRSFSALPFTLPNNVLALPD